MRKNLIFSLICYAASIIFFIFGVAFMLPYILSFVWIHNPEAIAPMPYWCSIPCFIASFILFETALEFAKKMEEK